VIRWSKPAVLALALGTLLLGLAFPGGPFGLERAWWDARQRWMPAPLAESDLLILAVNERSVELLEEDLGRWPWPREIMGRMVDFLARAGAKSLAVDIIFPNPDEGDEALKGALAGIPHILAADIPDQPDAEPVDCEERLPMLLPGGKDLPDFPTHGLPCSILLPGTPVASIHLVTDPDGVARRYPLVQRSGDRLFPSLASAMAGLPVASEPRDFALRFYGPPGAFDTLDAWKALVAAQVLETEGETPEALAVMERVKGRAVLMGVTATSGFDRVVAPTAEIFPGIELHATAYANLKHGQQVRPLRPWLWLGACLILGAALAAALVRSHRLALKGSAFGAALLLLAGGSAFLFRGGRDLPLTWPALALFVLFAGFFTLDFLAEMRERRKVTSTFARYVSPQVLDYLLESHQLPPLGGERKEITVLFSDIRSFTTISESTPPDLLVEWLNDYFSLLVTVIFRHQGTFDKFIGDAVMAYWGAPTPQADHAERAVRCAREMVIELKKWNADRAARGLPPLNNGVGIHSGPAVVGEMGAVVEGRRQVNFTCLGDTVNTASRVEGLTKGFGRSILFTEGTARLLPPDLAVEALGSTEVKGKHDSVTIFSLKEDL